MQEHEGNEGEADPLVEWETGQPRREGEDDGDQEAKVEVGRDLMSGGESDQEGRPRRWCSRYGVGAVMVSG